MTWQVAKLSSSSGQVVAPTSTWRVAKLVAGSTSATSWRVASLSASPSLTPQNWRVARLSATLPASWRVASLIVAVSVDVTPVLATIPDSTADPVYPKTITAVVTNGVVPDTVTFTSPGVVFVVNGLVATFSPPGTLTGTTLTVTVTATKNGNSVSTQTHVIVAAANSYYKGSDGLLHAMSLPYYSKG